MRKINGENTSGIQAQLYNSRLNEQNRHIKQTNSFVHVVNDETGIVRAN